MLGKTGNDWGRLVKGEEDLSVLENTGNGYMGQTFNDWERQGREEWRLVISGRLGKYENHEVEWGRL